MAKDEKGMWKNKKCWHCGGSSGAVYGLGFVGALIYYLQHAATFSDGILGALKALVWPAIFVYQTLQMFKF